jgi:hypothetical protein
MRWLPWRIFSRWRAQRACFHHALRRFASATSPTDLGSYPVSYIESTLIDIGRRKMYRCRECRQVWFT